MKLGICFNNSFHKQVKKILIILTLLADLADILTEFLPINKPLYIQEKT